MKQNVIYRQIRRISIINLIIPGILTVILVILYFHLPFEDILSPQYLESADLSDSFYSKDIRFVDITFDTLYYTGYDCVKNGNIYGYYYYSLDNGNCTFVLVDAHNINKPTEVINGYSMKASLDKQNHLIDQMIGSFSKDLQWTKDGLLTVSSICYINETGFNSSLYLILGLCLFVLLTLLLSYLIVNILYIIAPGLCPACMKFKRLSGNISDLIYVNHELENSVVLTTKNITVTEHYFVYMGNLSTEIIPLNKINHIHVHRSWKHFLLIYDRIFHSISFHCAYKVKVSVSNISDDDYNALMKHFKELNILVKK